MHFKKPFETSGAYSTCLLIDFDTTPFSPPSLALSIQLSSVFKRVSKGEDLNLQQGVQVCLHAHTVVLLLRTFVF